MAKSKTSTLIVLFLIACLFLALYLVAERAPEDRTYSIGWQVDPPNQVPVQGQEPTGLSIELVREAARRRGIRLNWVHQPGDAQTALVEKRVELWPILTITADRQKLFHLTAPYQEYEYGLLVRSDSPYHLAKDLKQGTVTSNGIGINAILIREHLRGLVHVSSRSSTDGIQRMCRGEYAAYFGERYATFSALLDETLCPGVPLRMLPISTFHTQLGIGSVRQASAAADAIRSEMDGMVTDGTAEAICSNWGSPAAQALVSLTALEGARRDLWWYRAGTAAVAVLCLFAIWAAFAYRSARNRAEATGEALERAERKLRLLASSLSEMVVAYDLGRRLTYANPGAERLTGYPVAEMQAGRFAFWTHPDDRELAAAAWDRVFRGENAEPLMYRIVAKGGQEKWVSAIWGPIRDEAGKQVGVQATERDISEHKRAEAERIALEGQLLQAQKLESVGRLAGGVAHDFNNILTVISGFSQLLLLDASDPADRVHIQEIVKAADRAADLTAQLLAFSRKQVIQPKVLDVNLLIEDTTRMIQRLIGEDIELTTVLDPGTYPILADRGQIGQVLMNLAVNARDAMPEGGKLWIETGNATLDAQYAAAHVDVEAGDYVMLAVTDSGVGMDQTTLRQIFDPFFTTKGPGKGTGLGLATVYGVVKQVCGHIWAYSEPGKGTTFKLYFPRDTSGVVSELEAPLQIDRIGGSETILVAEDQEDVRRLVVEVLESLGYLVIQAGDGVQALKEAEQYSGPIHLMIADVIMPHMNGRELTDRLLQLRPGIQVLYVSGYTENVMANRGVLTPHVNFLSKPFTPSDLAAKVRSVLNRAD